MSTFIHTRSSALGSKRTQASPSVRPSGANLSNLRQAAIRWGFLSITFGVVITFGTLAFGQFSIGGIDISPPPIVEDPLSNLGISNVLGIELGHKTNKSDVRRDLEKDGWWVAYGKEVGYEEYYVFVQAIEASVASRNPGPAMAYLQYLIEESVRTLATNVGSEYGARIRAMAQQQIVAAIYDAMKYGRITTLQLEGIDLQLGMATYNRSESGVPLPNTFQPYLRVRLRTAIGGGLASSAASSNSNFRTGMVVLNNDYGPGGDVVIRIFHPQGGGRVYGAWPFRGQQNGALTANGQNIIVGSDWGIQIAFGNGVESPVRLIGSVSNFDDHQFVVNASRIMGQ